MVQNNIIAQPKFIVDLIVGKGNVWGKGIQKLKQALRYRDVRAERFSKRCRWRITNSNHRQAVCSLHIVNIYLRRISWLFSPESDLSDNTLFLDRKVCTKDQPSRVINLKV